VCSEIQLAWTRAFPRCPPLRFLLRDVYPERWLRVHSLPAAKRLPTGPEDEREMLRRHEFVADRMLRTSRAGGLVVAYANGYSGRPMPPSVVGFDLELMREWADQWRSDQRLAEDLEEIVFAASIFSYHHGLFSQLMCEVAYGKTAPLLFFAMDSGLVYSPYDGGADLFFESTATRDSAKIELVGWLSERADGL
jgi:hypothetical protein